ncbi:putative oxidoreductase C-terminal domain-containing protein [Geofilum rubicundum]|nr:putative oxidoreductase C-terminal domain-containing protein [Geofilum rubicundum]
MKYLFKGFSFLLLLTFVSCQQQKPATVFTGAENEVKLITLDPGHFHAALIQKRMYDQVDSVVHIYAPEGPDLDLHMQRIEGFNSREASPTSWHSEIYEGEDYLERMLREKKGNVVVLAGNNSKKTSYIKQSVEAGLNVLSDKPMVIDGESFEQLKEAFSLADQNNVLLYDVMTERYEITSQLQRAISQMPGLFGTLQKGSADDPAVVKKSIHHFRKNVAGSVLRRPPWYFDVNQQGEGIIDVTTHLVDLIQWVCFPDVVLDYEQDVDVYGASRWSTSITRDQFLDVTGLDEIPEYLEGNLDNQDVLNVFANGEMNYALKGVHAEVSVIWDFEAPEGGGDSHYSMMKGSLSDLVIRQGQEEGFVPMLFLQPAEGVDANEWKQAVQQEFGPLAELFPGIELIENGEAFRVEVPDHYRVGHEAHFGQVADKYLDFLVEGELPVWEVPNMLAKYYTTTTALQVARQSPLVPDPGVVSYSFREQFSEDVPATLDMIKEMGITNIEFSNLFGKSAEELRALLDERGMVCTSYGVSYDAITKDVQRVADEAWTLGAKYVRVAYIPFEDIFTLEDAQRTVRDFNEAGKALREKGLYFCYHNHGFEFRPHEDGTLFDYIVQNTHPDYVSFEIDLLWTMHPGADPVELLNKYPERFRLMHMKDLRKGVVGDFSGSTPRENDVVLGTGQVDFPAVLKAAQQTNIEYYYIEDENPDVVNRIPASRKYVMGISAQ